MMKAARLAVRRLHQAVLGSREKRCDYLPNRLRILAKLK